MTPPLRLAAAAERLGVRPDTLRKLCRLGLIGHRRSRPDGTGILLFDESDIAAYLDSTRVEPRGRERERVRLR